MTFCAKEVQILFSSMIVASSSFLWACSEDVTGFPNDLGTPGSDACTTNQDCPLDFICIDGVCAPPQENLTNTNTPTDDSPSETCSSGETRSCGTNVGACETGTETCINGVWGNCIGGISPITEECNGVDDDCDGEIPDNELDGDGDGLSECDGDCDNSNPNVYPSALEQCNGKDDNCNGIIDESADASCNDGLFCNGQETCVASQCRAGLPPSCTDMNTECAVGVCDEDTQGCLQRPVEDETPCNDGFSCTQNDTCDSGICSGSPLDCSQLSGSCALGVCDELAGGCVAAPLADGISCEDGIFCNGEEICGNGQCLAGTTPNCDNLSSQCQIGQCNEVQDTCVAANVANGSTCNDSQLCTQNDQCNNGTCLGQAISCSHLDDSCNQGSCSETAGGCYAQALPNGTSCEDGSFCTTSDSCISGSCVSGDAMDCSMVTGGDPCYDGVCSEDMNQCIAIDNESCNPCETGSPIAKAGPDQEAIPQQSITLDGTGSFEPDNQTLFYTWTMPIQPEGSSATLSSPTSSTPTLLVDLAGTYQVCLTVNDADECSSEEDCMEIIVKPQVDFHVELVWDVGSSDLDLHYRAPGGTFFDSCSSVSTDCYYCSTNPDWGLNGQGVGDGDSTNDPRLDVDNTSGFGPENINVGTLFDHSSPATVGVHYYCNAGGGPATARIRIYVGGELEYEVSKVLNQTEFWEVADITVSGSGTAVGITPLTTALYPSTEQSCH